MGLLAFLGLAGLALVALSTIRIIQITHQLRRESMARMAVMFDEAARLTK